MVGAVSIIKVQSEQLPDMNIPRYGHNLFYLNGEPIVIGGHTSGFVLTATAEYFKDGKWHLLPTVYPHDGGFGIAMKSGKILIAGGFKNNLGIGQSFEVESYDPVTHHFKGFGRLVKNRASAGAVELDSGQVLMTGNWYADDGMEIYDGQVSFTHVKDVCQSRYLPHLFRISGNDVLLVSSYGNRGQRHDSILIDRLHGETFMTPLFENWHPLQYDISLHSDESFIGDKEKGVFAYLMPVEDQSGHMAIVEVRDTVFSLLPTTDAIPMQSQWGEIFYYTPIYADRQRQRGYMIGSDQTGRQYALCVDYARKPAELTLYYTDELTDTTATAIPVLTDEGNLLLTGFKSFGPNSNFEPSASVWLLHFNEDSQAASSPNHRHWLWVILAIVVLVLMAVSIAMRKAKSKQILSPEDEHPSEPVSVDDDPLMQRIYQLMDKERPYLKSELKVSDVAEKLGVSSRVLSDCIKNSTSNTFANFINIYRIDHAKQLMRTQPDMKISEIFLRSGFANETTFFRIFKAITGMTPTEWKSNDIYAQ